MGRGPTEPPVRAGLPLNLRLPLRRRPFYEEGDAVQQAKRLAHLQENRGEGKDSRARLPSPFPEDLGDHWKASRDGPAVRAGDSGPRDRDGDSGPLRAS